MTSEGNRMNIVLMAQGKATRLPGKHFVSIRDREPIIERTVRLLRELAPEARVIAVAPSSGEWQRLKCDVLHTQPDPGHGLMSGIWNTSELWLTGRTTILLGDVVFSRQALMSILNEKRSGVFCGSTGPNKYTGCRYGEIFGLVVGEEFSKTLIESISTPAERAVYEGRLWGLWGRIKEKANWLEIDDWTDDVDTEKDMHAVRKYCARLKDF